jgi:hypothetical protein
LPGEILNATFSSVLVPNQVESEVSGLAFNYDSTLLRSEHLDQGACVQLFYSKNIFSFGCKQDLTDLGEQLESFRSAVGHEADFVRHITLPFPALEQPLNLAALEYFRLWTGLQRVIYIQSGRPNDCDIVQATRGTIDFRRESHSWLYTSGHNQCRRRKVRASAQEGTPKPTRSDRGRKEGGIQAEIKKLYRENGELWMECISGPG